MAKLKKPLLQKFSSIEAASHTLAPKGLTPFPHQLRSVDFAVARLRAHNAVYLALDPGLGKTISAALFSNLVQDYVNVSVYYLCPPFLVANVEAEFNKWSPTVPIRIIRDSVSHRREIVSELSREFLSDPRRKILFVDEAQRYNHVGTIRTTSLIDGFARWGFDAVVFLSGTPIPNQRAVEIWNIAENFAPDVFGRDYWSFARKYGDPQTVIIGKDKNGKLKKRTRFDGLSNKNEFKGRLTKSFMLRIYDHEVEGLPPRIENMLVLGDKNPAILAKLERKLLEKYGELDEYRERLAEDDAHFATYLQRLGLEKAKQALPFLEQVLTTTKENILIFAHHDEVIQKLSGWLSNFEPVVLTGKTPSKKRQGLVDEYMKTDKRVFIGNIVACGIGLNITKADLVLIVEPSWNDGVNVQALKRVQRYGRSKMVRVLYVVLKNSYDAERLNRVLGKRQGAV